jgi:hypothetical protein
MAACKGNQASAAVAKECQAVQRDRRGILDMEEVKTETSVVVLHRERLRTIRAQACQVGMARMPPEDIIPQGGQPAIPVEQLLQESD